MRCTVTADKANITEGTYASHTPYSHAAELSFIAKGGSLKSAEDELADAWERFVSLLPPEISDTLSGNGAEVGSIFEIASIFTAVLGSEMASITSMLASVILVTVLFATAELAVKDRASIGQTVLGGICVILCSPLLSHICGAISAAEGGLGKVFAFFGELVPIITTVASIGIGTGTASVYAAGMGLTLSACEWLILDKLYLLFALIFSLNVISSIDTGQGISSFTKSVRNLFFFLFGLTPLIIFGALSMGTAISTGKDTLILRGAKYAISGTVPVVGNVISGSIGALISGVKLLSGILGPFAVCVIVFYLTAPLIKLFVLRLCLCIGATASRFFGSDNGARFFETSCASLDCLIAPITSSVIIAILEIVCFVITVKGVSA
jgi:stage III sporulation protein AE